MRQAEEASCFLSNVGKIDEAEAFADHVEQIPMLAGRCVGPFAGSPFPGFRPGQADEHGAAWRIPHIPDLPVIALFAPVREVVAAHRLGLATKTLRQLGSVETCHHAATRSPIRSTGKRSSSLQMIAGPVASTGTKKRSFQEMISLKSP